jgi:hypothetical protein
MHFRRRVVSVCALTLALAVGPAALAAQARPAPRLANPLATAKQLVTRFFTLTQRKDVAGLRAFLSPAFQIERADGTGMGKAVFLKNLPDLRSFKLARFVASQAGSSLVTRYLATATGTVSGKPYTPGPAPRMTVFTWNGRAWQVFAHSNFNPLTGGKG